VLRQAIASWDHALRRGLAAVDHLIAGYHVWAPVLEAFGDVGYDQDTLVCCMSVGGGSICGVRDIADVCRGCMWEFCDRPARQRCSELASHVLLCDVLLRCMKREAHELHSVCMMGGCTKSDIGSEAP